MAPAGRLPSARRPRRRERLPGARAGSHRQRWHLRSGGALERGVNPASPPSTFTYDPDDPTPALGGPKLDGNRPGPRDNRPLEKRADVLTFTSSALESDLEVIGEVTAQVWLRADRPGYDLFVRLCDVDERGRSINVCDDLVTVRPEGITEVAVRLSPTAYVFRRGHRPRVE
ncbi:CocE/NonD family hydrolase [Actinoplanes sp. NPDC089786]|uniref:CocE/NonD family hydrolase n=1 Tax=Actinoplanes sp. NPDC089786 TaxID=3155185 RepID=UPI0034205365